MIEGVWGASESESSPTVENGRLPETDGERIGGGELGGTSTLLRQVFKSVLLGAFAEVATVAIAPVALSIVTAAVIVVPLPVVPVLLPVATAAVVSVLLLVMTVAIVLVLLPVATAAIVLVPLPVMTVAVIPVPLPAPASNGASFR